MVQLAVLIAKKHTGAMRSGVLMFSDFVSF